jgi:hypothetical protein
VLRRNAAAAPDLTFTETIGEHLVLPAGTTMTYDGYTAGGCDVFGNGPLINNGSPVDRIGPLVTSPADCHSPGTNVITGGFKKLQMTGHLDVKASANFVETLIEEPSNPNTKTCSYSLPKWKGILRLRTGEIYFELTSVGHLIKQRSTSSCDPYPKLDEAMEVNMYPGEAITP